MRRATILLWTAFGLMLVASGFLLLNACDLDTPRFLSTAQRFCPVPVDGSARDHAMAKRDALQSRIHDAELNIARIANCVTAPPANATPARPQAPAQHTENTNPGPTVGRRGKLEVTLWWNTTDDLDLTVECPGGYLSPEDSKHGPGICGDGVHDVDANQKMVHPVTDPKEHATWDSPPDGSYQVWVKAYMTSHPDPIDYWVRVQLDDEIKVCHNQVKWDGTAHTGYIQSPIMFKPEHPLPECHYENQPEGQCTGAGCK
jgi:hypothetical protein